MMMGEGRGRRISVESRDHETTKQPMEAKRNAHDTRQRKWDTERERDVRQSREGGTERAASNAGVRFCSLAFLCACASARPGLE
ncbi:hypothetical protein Mapa_017203 [Marchantia paleacea]|nr:hypothetical protein Mapa_017203 [Marchantia paleacea]